MLDLQTILANHNAKYRKEQGHVGKNDDDTDLKSENSGISEIPDVFFDDILVNLKLTRIETIVLMYLYRHVWCRPNMYREHGLTQILSHTEMSKALKISIDDVYHALRNLETLSLVETIRSGQYFVRRYFTKENDQLFGQNYGQF